MDILVVVDDPELLAVIEAALSDRGGRLVVARSRSEAQHQLLERNFAVILIDVEMPSLDALELACVVRDRACTQRVPIVFLATAHAQPSATDIERAYALGAVDYVCKPLVSPILRSRVQVCMEVARQAEQLRALEDELEAFERSKEDFLAMLAHELRNPLSPIVASLALLEPMLTEPVAIRARQVMQRQVHHLVQLIDGLVRLPSLDPKGAAARDHLLPSPAPGLRIALVEDDDDGREMVRRLLEQWGHAVMDAASAAEGVRLLQRERVDVALLDIGLPDLDGYELARRVRAMLGMATPRLIAVTAYGQDHDRRRAREAGFDAHITKPADPRLLQQILRAPTGS